MKGLILISCYAKVIQSIKTVHITNISLFAGAYPYNIMKSVKDFEQTTLPPKSDFFNHLSNTPISDKAYSNAQKVWESFKIRNMGEWHDLYVRTDVALLADIMEYLRKLMQEKYDLDLAHYLSLPMMALDCALKKSELKLDLLTDATMHCFVENAIRGGFVSVGSIRAAAANNPYMESTYNSAIPSSYIMYIDANNLYGKAMSSPLPVRDFEWLSDLDVAEFNFNIDMLFQRTDKDEQTGYILQVDLEIPPELHDKFNGFPPAPVKRCISADELSVTYQKPLMQDLLLGGGILKTKKLIADLHRKEKYILHYKVLREYIDMGVKVSKVHQGISFTQEPWLKTFIDYNTGTQICEI